MTDAQKLDRYGPIVAEVSSKSKPGDPPHQIRYKDGAYSCNCGKWAYSSQPKACDHTRAMERQVPLPTREQVLNPANRSGIYPQSIRPTPRPHLRLPPPTVYEPFGPDPMDRFDPPVRARTPAERLTRPWDRLAAAILDSGAPMDSIACRRLAERLWPKLPALLANEADRVQVDEVELESGVRRIVLED